MKVFISSVIQDFAETRSTATKAIRSLGHEVVRAEDFAASPNTPQVARLAGVRSADAVVVILGARYGAIQPSGRSATHEEFDEAKENKPTFVFVQSGVTPEPRQKDFIAAAQSWSTGNFTTRFSDQESLQSAITTSLHRWEVTSAAGRVDANEILGRALEALPEERRGYSTAAGPALAIALVGGPRQSILRPSELEANPFQRDLIQRTMFGEPSIFTTASGVKPTVDGHTLVLTQAPSSLRLNEEGAILLTLTLPRSGHGLPAIIEEDVHDTLVAGLRFGAGLLDLIDATERLSHVVVAVGLINSSHAGWRTRREHEKSPNSMRMSGMYDDNPLQASLSPPHRSRGALRQQIPTIAEDLTVLLRRLMSQ